MPKNTNTPRPPEDPWLSTAQVAAVLGITVDAASKRIYRGMIPSIKIGRSRRVRASVLDAYVAAVPHRAKRGSPT